MTELGFDIVAPLALFVPAAAVLTLMDKSNKGFFDLLFSKDILIDAAEVTGSVIAANFVDSLLIEATIGPTVANVAGLATTIAIYSGLRYGVHKDDYKSYGITGKNILIPALFYASQTVVRDGLDNVYDSFTKMREAKKKPSRSLNNEAGEMNTRYPYEENLDIGAHQAGGNPEYYHDTEKIGGGMYGGARY